MVAMASNNICSYSNVSGGKVGQGGGVIEWRIKTV